MSGIIIAMLVAAVVLVVVILLSLRRRVSPRSDDRVESFQRHLGALSPEARRQSIDRVQNPRSKGDS